MKVIQPSSKRFSRPLEVPNLIELQLNSYKWFLEEGLKELFKTFSPIYDYQQITFIELVSYSLAEPKYSIQECRDRDMTFEAALKAVVRVGKKGDEFQESEVYLGDLPLMTEKGTFIINGREKVVVSQLIRSPGLFFEEGVDNSMQVVVSARIIPNEGPWLDVEADANDYVSMQLAQNKKFPLTELIKGLAAWEVGRAKVSIAFSKAERRVLLEPLVDGDTGEVLVEAGTRLTTDLIEKVGSAHANTIVLTEMPLATNEDLIRYFTDIVEIDKPTASDLVGGTVLEDLFDGESLLIAKGETINLQTATRIEKMNLDKIKIEMLLKFAKATLEKDSTTNAKEAVYEIYRKLRPGDTPNDESVKGLFSNQFFEVKRYDLGKVGRRFLNQKLGIDVKLDTRNLTAEDLAGILKSIAPYMDRKLDRDDIDDLRNKRVRSIGEQLQSQLRGGFSRMEKVARERMAAADQENPMPGILLSVKPVASSIKAFFSTSQLSQLMDQTNPLSEITIKRRLSALGTGGVQRANAKLEVRDVHRSHYGRICPIETPEGANIGLISQLTTLAHVDEYGFISTPYRKVTNGAVTDEIIYLTAQEETGLLVAPADTVTLDDGTFVQKSLQVRSAGGTYNNASYPIVDRERVDLMDIAPVQIISVATALIPFLENDDANRALMGANMQRQAVPLLRSERALVGTGYEPLVAVDSGAAVVAKAEGTVEFVTAKQITVRRADGTLDSYELMHLAQSNKSTCFTHRPVVVPGQFVLKGDPLADGACCDNGNLALGRNLLVAFMPWNGYNYEDAILISERLVKDDVYTSIHIERHETEAVDTKLGPEEITRDIPNVGEEALRDLDENGIIRVGAEVRPEDILVGKVAPKGQVDLTAEERLIIAIFGKKAEETRDVSLRLPHGEKGTVVDVKVFSRFNYISQPSGILYKESKRREHLECDRTGEPLVEIEKDELAAGVNMSVQIFTATKRKLMVGDKMAGRHGNKGVISKVLPVEDMPYLNDGTPVDIVLNPLGVPSRMNIGQILETHLGYVGKHLGIEYKCPAFEGATEKEILGEMDKLAHHMRSTILTHYVNRDLGLAVKLAESESWEEQLSKVKSALKELDGPSIETLSRILAATPTGSIEKLLEQAEGDEEPVVEPMGPPANLSEEAYDEIIEKIRANTFERAGIEPHSCKSVVRDGLTGDRLPNPITVGTIYMLKLEHLVDEKIHARSTGPYSLVTQQPLGGKAQFGGQRFGEMEVWALEAYGAAYTLQELLTIKSDDVNGRVKAYESIVKGDTIGEPGVPESFKILVNELRSLCLKVTVENADSREIQLKDLDELGSPLDDTRLAKSVGIVN